MKRSHKSRLPTELEPIAARLAEHRIETDELILDRVKQRALARSQTRSGRGFFMARVATALTTFVLVGVFGGALAVAQFDSHSNSQGGAADAQYTSPVSAGTVSAQSATTPTSTSAHPAQASSGTLPFTGENVLTALLVAAFLVGTGVLLMPRQRRRRE